MRNAAKKTAQSIFYFFSQLLIATIQDINLENIAAMFFISVFLENLMNVENQNFSNSSSSSANSLEALAMSATDLSLVPAGLSTLVVSMTKTISFANLRPLLVTSVTLELLSAIPRTSAATIEEIEDEEIQDNEIQDNEIQDDEIENIKAETTDQEIQGSEIEKSTTDFPKPSSYEVVPYRGINLSGFEWGPPPVPPTLDEATYFINVGMNTIRLPFRWESFQPDLNQPIDFNSGLVQQYVQMVNTFTDAGITVIIDMHNYMLYNNQIIGESGSAATTEDYANAWSEIATEFLRNSNVLFDLMNEPNSMATELILTNYNAAIAAIRSVGSNHTLFLEGNAWSGLAHWSDNWYGTPNSLVFIAGNIKDIYNNFVINVHEYLNDPGGGGDGYGDCVDPNQVMVIEKFSSFIQWLQNQSFTAFLTESGGEATDNCIQDIDILLTNIEANGHNSSNVSGFIGWTLWSGGSFDPSYALNLARYPNGTERPQMSEAVDHHLTPAMSLD